MKNYLITGGAGFIGSHYLRYLLKKEPNSNIFVIDKLTYAGDLNRIDELIKEKKINFYKGDINNEVLIERIIIENKINRIVNFAAESHVDRSINSQKEFIESNVMGVQKLLSISNKVWNLLEIKDTLFTQISTDEVYGSSDSNSNFQFTEDDLLNPQNPYSASKASAEHLITSFMNTFNYNANIIRSTNNYGVGQNKEKFIPKLIKSYLNDEHIIIYGDGLNKRCWLNVEDNCRGIYAINENKKNQVYNIKGNLELSNIALVKKIVKIIEKEYKLDKNLKIKNIEDRKGHDYFYNVSDKKIRNDLGFKVKINFKEGVKKIVNSYLD